MNAITNDIQILLDMLTYKRRYGSDSELAFVEKFITPLKSHANVTDSFVDGFGNHYYEVCGGGKSLMTAHTDTVHSTTGSQVIEYDPGMGLCYKSDGEPLGADDGAGCWLLTEFINAGVPCWVAFFRAEEVGGQGSKFAAQNNPEFFKQFDRCVSFDRRGTSDVITHQAWGRCCSDEFADHLSTLLTACGLDYSPCDGGIFTDSANLTTLIPECSNASVGYSDEHSSHETLDVEHLVKLRDACISIEWDSLITARDPSVVEDDRWSSYSWQYANHSEPVRDFAYAETSDVMEMTFSKLTAWVSKQDANTVAEVMLDLIDRIYMLEDEADVAAHEAYETEEVSPFDRRM